jgi:hypothetical protein
MPRYTKQYDQYNCGPVAVVNALKWAGEKVSYRECKFDIMDMCGGKQSYGAPPWILGETLGQIGRTTGRFDVVRHSKLTLKDIERVLKEGKAILLIHPNRVTGGRHYVLMVNMLKDGSAFAMVNEFHGGSALRWISREGLKDRCLFVRQGYRRPWGWVLTKI